MLELFFHETLAKADELVVYSLGKSLLVLTLDDEINKKDGVVKEFALEMVEGSLENARKLDLDAVKRVARESQI